MARTSRWKIAAPSASPKEKIYHVGIYVRLSVLDNHKTDSDSIENQEAMLRSFIAGNSTFTLYSVYRDNGETGTNFERDDFERLIEDVKIGAVDCIIVKDLSRFGRNYIEAGEYLEKIFPFMGVRFIAVNDHYDNIDPASSDILTMHLKNLVNDIYARDISHKISPVLRRKQERGEFIGAWASYGYRKSDEDRHRIVIEEETAAVVRSIFQWRLEGMSIQKIVRKLTADGIPSPSQYRYAKGLVKQERFSTAPWRAQTVKLILGNEVYLGNTVQGRKRESLFLGEKQAALPRDQWIVVPGTHEAIIPKAIFDRVQEISRQSAEEYAEKLKHFPKISNTENILKGLVYCGCCGTKLVRYKNVRENKHKTPKFHVWYTYICPCHAGDLTRCTFLGVSEKKLLEVVFAVIHTQITTALNMESLMKSAKQCVQVQTERQIIENRLKKASTDVARLHRLKESLYDDYLEHLMNERDYLYAQNRYANQIQAMEELIADLRRQEQDIRESKTDENPWMQKFLKFQSEADITREMVEELVDKVIVYGRDQINVQLRFQDEYKCLLDGLSLQQEVAAGE